MTLNAKEAGSYGSCISCEAPIQYGNTAGRCRACNGRRISGISNPFRDRAGERYGHLLVISFVDCKGRSRRWLCRCDCGTEKVIRYKLLSNGHTKSCGCLNLTNASDRGGRQKKPPGTSALNQLLYNYRKSARERGYEFSLDPEEFASMTKLPCWYCGFPPSRRAPRAAGTNGDYLHNGIDRVDNSRGYTSDNVRPCCKQCNISKGVLTEADFLAWAERLSAHRRGN